MKKLVGKSLFKKVSLIVVVTMIVSIMSALSFLPVSAAVGDDILLTGGTAPMDTSFETEVWGGMAATPDEKNTGAQSALMVANGYASKWVSAIALKPDTQYAYSYYFKSAANINTNKIDMQFTFNNGTKNVTVDYPFMDYLSTFTKKTLIFNTPAVLGRTDAYNNFGMSIWTASDIFVDDVSLIEVGPAAPIVTPTPEPTVKPTAAPTPMVATSVTISAMTNKSLAISGKTVPAKAKFTLKYGKTTKSVVSSMGKWKVTLTKALAAGTTVTAVYGKKSTFIVVKPAAPIVNKVKANTNDIVGTATKGSMVYAMVGGKAMYKIKANAKTGAFHIEAKGLIKKGTAISVKCFIVVYSDATNTKAV